MTKKKALKIALVALIVVGVCGALSTCTAWLFTPTEVVTLVEVTATSTEASAPVPTEVIPTSTPEPTEVIPTSTPNPTSTPRTAWTPHPTPRPLPTKVQVTQEPATVPPTLVPTSTLWPSAVSRVVSVVDGDTIKVEVGGTVYTVRYIGIDTPETVHPSKPVEWMGPEASEANKRLVEGQVVFLEKDVSETDRYGRLLRYVYLADGLFVNAELVRLGYAKVSTYPPDVQYADLFLQLQQEARDAERGLWEPAPLPSEPTPVPPPSEPVVGSGSWACPNSTEGAIYVGSVNSDKYHELSCHWAGKIKPENRICFASRAAAESAGYISCKVCKP